MTHWTVYSRAGCTLCEQLLEEFGALLGPAAAARVEVVDISGDEGLEARYGRRIPVVMADGEFVCAYHLDRDRVDAILSADAARPQ